MCWHAGHDWRRGEIDGWQRNEIDGVDDDAQERRERAFVHHAQRSGTILLICLAIWLFTGAGYFWPVWVLLFVGIKVGLHAWHVYGQPVTADVDA